MKETLEIRFLRELRKSGKINFGLWNAFSILHLTNEDFLQWVFEEYQKERDLPEDNRYWFTAFHKMFRQADMFQSDGRYGGVGYFTRIISDEEYAERDKLRGIHYKNRTNEETARIRELSKKYHTYKYDHEENISGHLDSIVWNLIAMDKYFYEFLDGFFWKETNKLIKNGELKST